MAENASASLPAQMQTWKDMIDLYRLLDEADVTFHALMQPHWQQTREQIEMRSVVLLVQDTASEEEWNEKGFWRKVGGKHNNKTRKMISQKLMWESHKISSRLSFIITLHQARVFGDVSELRTQGNTACLICLDPPFFSV